MSDAEKRTLNDKFMLRLPDGMRERIKAAADQNNRSMNAEIVARLDISLSGENENFIAEKFYNKIQEMEATIGLLLDKYDTQDLVRKSLNERLIGADSGGEIGE